MNASLIIILIVLSLMSTSTVAIGIYIALNPSIIMEPTPEPLRTFQIRQSATGKCYFVKEGYTQAGLWDCDAGFTDDSQIWILDKDKQIKNKFNPTMFLNKNLDIVSSNNTKSDQKWIYNDSVIKNEGDSSIILYTQSK